MSNCACFPFAFTIAISAAEKNDMVPLAFKRFGEIYAREDERKEMERSSAFYPLLTTICSLAVMFVMMLVVYPHFAAMFEGVGSELPGLSKALLAIADSFKGMWWLITAIIILILLAIFIFRKASSADIFGPKLGEKSLPRGSYKRMNVYAKFARYMNALLTVGVATKDALFLTAHSFHEYPFLTARLLDAANASAAGSTLSNALCVFDFFPIMILQMISVGEEMGDTPRMLINVAMYYEEEARREAAKKTARREPVSIAVMAVVVLFLLLSMLWPMLKFFELVKTL
jgi:type II secretory pathway component PulF